MANPKHFPCPKCLESFTFPQILNAFIFCYNKRSNFNINKTTSLFGQVYTQLTGFKESTKYTRSYLHHIWTTQIKVSIFPLPHLYFLMYHN